MEYTVDTFANRGEPLPVLNLPGSDDGPAGLASSDEEGYSKDADSKSDAAERTRHSEPKPDKPLPKSHKRSTSLQDRLFAKSVSYLS